MKITYLGTGAAEGVPAQFCTCPVCREARKRGGREIRTRSQTLIDEALCIDYPPDAYAHSLAFGVDLSAIGALLVTHSHMDHFYAHDFILRGYKYAREMTAKTLTIYGNEEVKKVFDECTRREMRQDVAAGIFFVTVRPFEAFGVGSYRVTAFPAVHTQAEDALLYLVEKDGKAYLHLHDTGKLTEETYGYLEKKQKRLSLVTLDCTLVDTSSSTSGRHMGLKENEEVMRRLQQIGAAGKETKFVITHFSHNSAPLTDRLKDVEERYGVVAAYDGMSVEI